MAFPFEIGNEIDKFTDMTRLFVFLYFFLSVLRCFMLLSHKAKGFHVQIVLKTKASGMHKLCCAFFLMFRCPLIVNVLSVPDFIESSDFA